MIRTGRVPVSVFLLVAAQIAFCKGVLAQTDVVQPTAGTGQPPTDEAPAPAERGEFPAADTEADAEHSEAAAPTAEPGQPPADGSSALSETAESPPADIEPDARSAAQVPSEPPSASPTVAPVITATPYAPEPTPTERTAPRTNLVMLGGAGGLGFIYPQGINRYLDHWVDSQPGYVVSQEGTSDMFLSFVPNVSLVYGPIEYIQFELFTDLGWAPKIISIQNGNSHVFHFLRVSPGVVALFHVPFNDYENSIFFGGGVEYDWMTFEGAGADTMGIRAKAGWRAHDRHFTVDAFGAFLYSKADTRLDGARLDLDYTSAIFGVDFYFRAYEE